MQDWVFVKEAIVVWAGVDRDALTILASLLLSLGAAMVSRRPLADGVPWLMIAAFGVLDMTATVLGRTPPLGLHLGVAVRDLLLFMAVPTVLVIVARFIPRLIVTPPDRRILIPAVWEKKAPVVEAVFREDSNEPASRKASAG